MTDLPQRLEEILLGGKRRYTRLEVAAKSGVPLERATELWHSLGFAAVPDDAVVFTDGDLAALRTANELIQAGITDPAQASALARVMGQQLGRLAESQVETLRDILVADPELAADERALSRFIERLVPDLERLQSFSWRRHLAAYSGRALAAQGDDTDARHEVVGFADMVGFTAFTRRSSEAELVSVVDRFDAVTAEVVAEAHGRIVKMIGDEVLFTAGGPERGAEIALTLLERAEELAELPLLRAGLAYGRVLNRFGDVYGSVVNLASRLASIARPGTVLIDRELADALADHPSYVIRHRRPVSVRGYARLRASVLRRADAVRVPRLPLEPEG
ncbi:MAG TPA: adenylate/guanylate cyclase domain-containing protein [Actinophytocola sp.]|uniref:adenylate/guanylate cyclase domain-containing protein n=1 Tax=Actinophytocola sp. TaxID=1872138 RepID=UPI002DDD59C6|nr:adenylate/guanylate cyclase domain-containing protein [Actinophytocola sp.]HEV2782062.1 adenylate/guanylate cyclase domain-containing protein [Actinophytocola sp.]